MRSYSISYSDKSFFIEFKEDAMTPSLKISDAKREFGGLQIMFLECDDVSCEKMNFALRNAAEAFNTTFQSLLKPITEEEKELTFEEMSF